MRATTATIAIVTREAVRLSSSVDVLAKWAVLCGKVIGAPIILAVGTCTHCCATACIAQRAPVHRTGPAARALELRDRRSVHPSSGAERPRPRRSGIRNCTVVMVAALGLLAACALVVAQQYIPNNTQASGTTGTTRTQSRSMPRRRRASSGVSMRIKEASSLAKLESCRTAIGRMHPRI